MPDLPAIDPLDELTCLGHGEDLAAQGGALSPPVVRTSLFAQPSLEALVTGLAAEHRHHVYTRGQNPTVEAVETKIARLERAERAKAFASGMAAVSAVMTSLVAAGDHILFVNQIYGPTLQLAAELGRFGVEHDAVLDGAAASVRSTLKPNTRLVWIESPGTMLFGCVDVAAIAALARRHGARTVLDNSWATPLFQKPLERGIDLVVHSASKYLAGHSDLVAGALAGSAALLEEIYYRGFLLGGGALSPADAWLLNRGMRTLPLRMRRHHADGLAVARFLAVHRAVDRVFHPGLAASGTDAAGLTGYAGLFSFALVRDRYEDVARVLDRLRLFRLGVSWGGVESLAITPRRPGNRQALAARGIPAGTIRLSVGLEGAEALIADLDQALAA